MGCWVDLRFLGKLEVRVGIWGIGRLVLVVVVGVMVLSEGVVVVGFFCFVLCSFCFVLLFLGYWAFFRRIIMVVNLVRKCKIIFIIRVFDLRKVIVLEKRVFISIFFWLCSGDIGCSVFRS